MRTLFDFYPTAIDSNIVKQVSDLHIDCLVSFLMPKEHHTDQYQLIGTGFFMLSPDPTSALLMTARHVLEQFDLIQGRITVGTKVLSLGDIGLRRLDPRFDVAQWEIPANKLIEDGVSVITTLPVCNADEADQNFIPMDSFIILGYPSSKNKKLDFREDRKPDRAIFAMALHGSKLITSSRTREFEYRGVGIPETWSKSTTTPPNLIGMSGSPCLRLVIHRSTSKISAILAGIFFAWNKQNHKLSVASLADPWSKQ